MTGHVEQDAHDEAKIGRGDEAGDKPRPSGIARLRILDEPHDDKLGTIQAPGEGDHEGRLADESPTGSPGARILAVPSSGRELEKKPRP